MTVTDRRKREVRRRAQGCCEYCRLGPEELYAQFHTDHIISVKHGGSDSFENLSLACPDCNGFKGPIIAALDPLTDAPTRLYNPREQDWDEHFELNADMTIAGLTPEGRATTEVLRLNMPRRVVERYEAWMRDEYPCEKPATESIH